MTDASQKSAPLLSCDGARIDSGGVPLLQGLSCVGAGNGLGLVGAWTPLFALLGREAELGAGRIEVDGADARRATALGVVGLARHEPGMPPGWSAARYLTESARLLGLSMRQSRHAAHEALDSLGLAAIGPRSLARLDPVERRALLIAHATLGAPRVLALEAPLDGLDAAAQARLLPLVDRAAAGRRLLWSVAAPAPAGAARGLLDRMDEVLVLEAGSLVAEGPPGHALAPGTRYLVTVARGASELTSQLEARGLGVRAAGEDGPSTAARLIVELRVESTPNDVLSAALELSIPVLELVPLAAAPTREAS
jgi:ABC-type multidrug transport system ATPase subunit